MFKKILILFAFFCFSTDAMKVIQYADMPDNVQAYCVLRSETPEYWLDGKLQSKEKLTARFALCCNSTPTNGYFHAFVYTKEGKIAAGLEIGCLLCSPCEFSHHVAKDCTEEMLLFGYLEVYRVLGRELDRIGSKSVDVISTVHPKDELTKNVFKTLGLTTDEKIVLKKWNGIPGEHARLVYKGSMPAIALLKK